LLRHDLEALGLLIALDDLEFLSSLLLVPPVEFLATVRVVRPDLLQAQLVAMISMKVHLCELVFSVLHSEI
jgi:hypothetical protein